MGQLQTQQESLVVKKQLAIKAHRQTIETQLQNIKQQLKALEINKTSNFNISASRNEVGNKSALTAA